MVQEQTPVRTSRSGAESARHGGPRSQASRSLTAQLSPVRRNASNTSMRSPGQLDPASGLAASPFALPPLKQNFPKNIFGYLARCEEKNRITIYNPKKRNNWVKIG